MDDKVPVGEMRSRDNCPFYPACYVAGDCEQDRWKVADCGLPRAEQKRRADKWRADLALKIERIKLGRRLAAEALAGKHDRAPTNTKDMERG